MERLLNLKYDLVRNKIILNSPPSLRELATVRVAVNQWYEEAIDNWNVNELQSVMQDKVLLLIVPETLKENIALMSELVGDQLNEFIRLVEKILCISTQWRILQNRIYWTSQGTIDLKSTVESFADCDDLNLETRFKIAVEFYLEDRFDALIDQLPSDYFDDVNGNDFPSLCIMNGMPGRDSASTVHSKISSTYPPDSTQRFKLALEKSNKTVCHFYWLLLAKSSRLMILSDLAETYFNLPDIFVFLFTQFEQETKVELLHDNSYFVFNLLNALFGLHWFPILDACVSEMSNCLEIIGILILLAKFATKKLESSFAYKEKYTQKCFTFIQLLKRKTSETNYSYDARDWQILSSVSCGFLLSRKEILFEILLESMSAENRKELFSHFNCFILKVLLVFSVMFDTNDIFSILLPSIEDRQKLLTDERFINVISGFLEMNEEKWVIITEKIFTKLFSNFGDVETYKRQFVMENKTRLREKFAADGQLECINKLFCVDLHQ